MRVNLIRSGIIVTKRTEDKCGRAKGINRRSLLMTVV
jgi:hypothetical protein